MSGVVDTLKMIFLEAAKLHDVVEEVPICVNELLLEVERMAKRVKEVQMEEVNDVYDHGVYERVDEVLRGIVGSLEG